MNRTTVIVLENIRSLNNVGAIFRSCDGAGVAKLYLTGYTPMPPRKMISKTALGAEQTIPWEYCENVSDIIDELKSEGYIIFGAEKTNNSTEIRLDMLTPKVAFVVGNEVEGISQVVEELSDHIIHLPMRGEKSSLNVSVAASILMYLSNMH